MRFKKIEIWRFLFEWFEGRKQVPPPGVPPPHEHCLPGTYGWAPKVRQPARISDLVAVARRCEIWRHFKGLPEKSVEMRLTYLIRRLDEAVYFPFRVTIYPPGRRPQSPVKASRTAFTHYEINTDPKWSGYEPEDSREIPVVKD